MLVDTHFHLDLMTNMLQLIQEMELSDVGIIAVGTTPKAYKKELQFCGSIEKIKVGLGFHPQLVADRMDEMGLFLSLVRDARYIGEIGLDFNTNHIVTKEQQLFCFRKIANACAVEGGKVLSIHSVKSVRTVLDELESAGTFRTCKCIFHWFTGNKTQQERAISNGAFFSVNPKMLNTRSGQEIIKRIPTDRILLESDAPFAVRCSSVSGLKSILQRLTDRIISIRGEDCAKQIKNNSIYIFNNML